MIGLLTQVAQVTSEVTSTGGCTINGHSASCSAAGGILAGVFGVMFFVFYLPIILISIISMWKIFTKAGKPGWASIVPIYNTVVMLEIIGRPIWWILLLLIPFVNIVIAIMMLFDLAKAFGKEGAFGLLLLFLPFIGYPILAFGKAKYVGPVANKGGGSPNSSAPAPPTPPAAPDTPSTPAPAPPQPPAAPSNPIQ